MTSKDIYHWMDRWAQFDIQMDFDNAGFLVGRKDREVSSVLVSLDITLDVVQEARELGCQMIVSHHPVIFNPVKHLTDESPTGEILLALAENEISAVCAHTNLDAAQGGVNDCLAHALELRDIAQLCQDGTDRQGRAYGIGRIGLVHRKGMSARAYAGFVKEKLNAAGVRFVDAGRPVEYVAVGGGSCGSMLHDVWEKGCDTFVTADVKYDVFLEAKALGINLMDAGHYATETIVCPEIAARLRREFPQLNIMLTQRHHEVYGCI